MTPGRSSSPSCTMSFDETGSFDTFILIFARKSTVRGEHHGLRFSLSNRAPHTQCVYTCALSHRYVVQNTFCHNRFFPVFLART